NQRATPSRRRSRNSMAPSSRTRPSRLTPGYSQADSRISTPNAESSRAAASAAATAAARCAMSAQLDGPAVDRDALGAQLGGAILAWVGHQGHGLAGPQVAFGQASAVQARERGENHPPGTALMLDGQFGVRVAVAHRADFGFQRQDPLAVV